MSQVIRIVASLVIIFAVSGEVMAITVAKKVNLLSELDINNAPLSPYFRLSPDGLTAVGSAVNSGGTLRPEGDIQAGTVSSITTNGTFSFTGNSTLAGNWVNGNGIPTGITLTFKTSMVFSVGAGSPVDSVLTAAGNSGSAFGNGLGITQTANSIGAIDVGESLDVSAVTVSDISFTGNVPGYIFTPGTVANFGPYLLRTANDNNANGFTESTEVAGLNSASATPDPNKPTIGFGGTSAMSTGDGLPGDGVVAGHLAMENTFALQNPSPNGHPNFFPRQIGAWTFQMTTGAIAIKGIGYEYDVSYDLTPNPPGDYNKNGVVDAADYVLWRKGDLAADSNGDTFVDQADYDFWRANFDNPNPSPGAGAGLSGASVPEPAALALLAVGLIATCSCRRFSPMRS